MIINNLTEFKVELQKVLDKKGVTDFCKKCIDHECCYVECDYVINKKDCLGDKFLKCYFYLCHKLSDTKPAVLNWLNKIHEDAFFEKTLEFPFEMKEFGE